MKSFLAVFSSLFATLKSMFDFKSGNQEHKEEKYQDQKPVTEVAVQIKKTRKSKKLLRVIEKLRKAEIEHEEKMFELDEIQREIFKERLSGNSVGLLEGRFAEAVKNLSDAEQLEIAADKEVIDSLENEDKDAFLSRRELRKKTRQERRSERKSKKLDNLA